MLRRLLTLFAIAFVVLAPLPRRAAALPPSPETDMWNEGPAPVQGATETDAAFKVRRDAWLAKRAARRTWNCYNYGVNTMTTAGGQPVRAHPGQGRKWPNLGVAITAPDMCTKTRDRARADGLNPVAWNPGDAIPTPPVGENLVALGGLAGDKGDGADYHWWRLNGDGTWSHKRGGTNAKTTYTDNTGAMPVERNLTDPREAAQRDGYDLCGFMSVPKAGITVGPLAALPTCTPQAGTVLVQAEGPSGFPDPQRVLTSTEISQLIFFLPSFSPSNQVPDPSWPALPGSALSGLVVITGVDGFGSIPPDMKVHAGVVEVVHAWPDHGGPVFYRDDNGLESFLLSAVLGQQPVACETDSGVVYVTPCQCSDEALGVPTTGVGEVSPEFALSAVVPNPSHGPVRAYFALPRESDVRLTVVDVAGRVITVLTEGLYPSGRFQASWSGRTGRGEASAGVYFMRLRVDGKTLVRPFVLTR